MNPEGQILWLKAKDIVPSGYVAKDVVLSTPDYKKLRGDGFLPLSDLNLENNTVSALSPFLHDLSHFAPLVQNPRLMVADRALAKSGYKRMPESFEEYLTETLVWTNPKHRSEIQEFLKKFGVDADAVSIQSDNVLNQLKGMSNETINQLIGELITNQYRWYSAIGGASADMIFRRDSANRRQGLQAEFFGLSYMSAIYPQYAKDGRIVENMLADRRHLLGRRDTVLLEVAYHLTQMQITSRYSVELFFTDVANPQSASPMLRQLLLDSKSSFFPAHQLFDFLQ